MKLGTPTAEVPKSHQRKTDGKYAEIYRQVDELKDGEWLPVDFDTKKRAYNFRVAIETHRTRVMEGSIRGRTVYVRNKPSGRSKEKK